MLLLLACTAPTGATDAKALLRSIFTAPTEKVLACPISREALVRETSVVGGQARAVLKSDIGSYSIKGSYIDLVPRTPLTFENLEEELFSLFSMQTGFFRSPVAAFIYERGWRQNFDQAGFPGIEKEFAECSEFFAPVATGGTVVDLSCGSGLMTRRLVASGAYDRVFALDFSEQMLMETARRFEQVGKGAVDPASVNLVRADAAALPLRTGSVDALHAGAALHCWPKLEASLSEVCRALRPGGRFFATTFYEGAVPGRSAQGGAPGAGSMRFFKDAEELRGLLLDAGFDVESLDVRREGKACAVIKAEKPQRAGVTE